MLAATPETNEVAVPRLPTLTPHRLLPALLLSLAVPLIGCEDEPQETQRQLDDAVDQRQVHDLIDEEGEEPKQEQD